MRLATAFIALVGLRSLLNGFEAAAQASGGAMGSRSRAEVRISISVLPRFEAKTVSGREVASNDAGGISVLAINAPKLRYSVVRLDPAKEGSPGPRLLLVVPD